MRIWLKKKAVARFQEFEAISPKDHSVVGIFVEKWGVRVKYCDYSGRWFVDYNEDLSLPPDIPVEAIEKYTLIDRIGRGLRSDGVYSYGSAKLVAKTLDGTRQDISISGYSAADVSNAYTLFRQGKLQPTEDWEVKPSARRRRLPSPLRHS